MKQKQTTVNYVDKMQFYEEIVDYKASCKKAAAEGKPKPKIPDKIAMRILLIAENTSKKACYRDYTFRDIMVADAVENCIRYFDNFDLDRPEKNPFGYFTQYCIYAFGRRIYLEKKELYTKYKIAQQSGAEEFTNEDENGTPVQSEQLYDNINEFIDKFENNLAKAKAKEIKPKKGLERLEDEYSGPDTSIDTK